MRRLVLALAAPAAGIFAVLSAAGTASAAADGDVSVFRTEVSPLSVYQNPSGCTKLPADSHVLMNRSDKPVTIYADPFCGTPGLTIQPDHGAHVPPGSGSFSA